MGISFRRGAVLAALGLALVGLTPAGDARDAGSPQVLRDGTTARADRVVHDVAAVRFDVDRTRIRVEVEFRRPIAEMMFESVQLFLDCDNDGSTGLRGADLKVHSAIGTRFHPNSWVPETPGVPAPLDLRRTAWAHVEGGEVGVERRVVTTWTWSGMLSPPEFEGNRMWFDIPLTLLRKHGQNYNREVPVRFEVEGDGSEHPVPLTYLASDEGVDIRVDGNADDWSGGTRVEDPADELHADATDLDLLSVQLEHDRDSLFALVHLQGKGFGAGETVEDDIEDRDQVVFAVEPLGEGYEEVQEYRIWTWMNRVQGARFQAAVKDGVVEAAIARPPEQTSYRIVVWTDATRIDKIPDEGWFDLDTTPWRSK